jgi:UDP-N-acetylglucosamine 2-epimerase (non-hydrolysing)
MNSIKILSVVGARPNFMKIAPIILAINEHNLKSAHAKSGSSLPTIHHVLVHTGQHYDPMMSDAFFSDLNLPAPDVFLGVGSGSHAGQTAEIMKIFEGVILQERPDFIIVVGDVNSTLACALAASKISYDANGSRPWIAHVEAGLRSFDRSMPEEVNRILTDHISDLLFVTEESGIINLNNEGINEGKIYFVGNTMIDTLLIYENKAGKSSILKELDLLRFKFKMNTKRSTNIVSPFALVTLHRPSNVDNKDNFTNIIEALAEFSRSIDVVFPVHPRTQNKIKEFGLEDYFDFYFLKQSKEDKSISKSRGRILLLNPLGYIDFLSLMKNAKVVLTDSGGIQEETTCLGVPCVTIRENTERPVTVTQGTNILSGFDKQKIIDSVKLQMEKEYKKRVPELWDGKAAVRIIQNIVREGIRRKNDRNMNDPHFKN